MTSILNMTKEEQRIYKKKFKSSIEDLDQAQLDVIEAIGETFTPLMKNQGVPVSKSLAQRALEAQAKLYASGEANNNYKDDQGGSLVDKATTLDPKNPKKPSALEQKVLDIARQLEVSKSNTRSVKNKRLVVAALQAQAKLRGVNA